MAVLLAKRALPRTMEAPPPEVAEQLALLPQGFGQQSLDGPAVNLNLKKLTKPPGAWRLRTGDWRSIFFQTGEDFLVAAIGLRKDIYERADRMRLARRGEGLTVIETSATQRLEDGARAAAMTTQRAPPAGRGAERIQPVRRHHALPHRWGRRGGAGRPAVAARHGGCAERARCAPR